MLVIAKQDITIFRIVEVEDITRYYTLTKDWPDKPATNPPSSEWVDTEPETTFKQSASGTSLKLTDVSSVNHTMDVKVRSKNLIPFPYNSFSTSQNGLTATINDDTSITINGTATTDTLFIYASVGNYTIHKGTYTLSGCPSGGSNTTYCQVLGSSDFMDTGSGVTRTYAEDVKQNVFIKIFAGYKANNLVFKPQLELGTTATEYTPYVDVSTIEITERGKNLLPYPYVATGTQTRNGITFTDNGDGTATLNGTAEKITEFYLSQGSIRFSIGSTYIISSGLDKDSVDKYGISLQMGDGSYWKNPEVFKAEADKDIYLTIYIYEGCTANNLTFKPQIELGTVATEYEPYKEPKKFAVGADGTVENVTSLYPTTVLMSDTSGVVIDVEYSKDTSENLYFTDLTAYTDDTYKYSEVSKSSDYEAAKEAFNKALMSENTAKDAQDATDDLNANLTKTITEQYSALTTNIDSISGSVTKLETRVEETNASTQKTIAELQEQVNMSITSDEVNIAIEKKLQNGVTKVDTKTGFTFDENGLSVNKTGSETGTQITEDGMYVRNTETNKVVLTANKDGVEARDLKATTYLIVGGRSRFENYKTDRTGCFWIGG